MDKELSSRLDNIEKMLKENLAATLKLLSEYEQLAEQYERLRREHVINHPNSPSNLPVQMLHRK